MQIARTIAELRELLRPTRSRAFVPTMGNLHDGHIALIRRARPLAETTVASIFVNRLQFQPHEDFDTYPRTFEADCAKLEAAGCDVLFAPQEAEMHAEPETYKVVPASSLAGILEGEFRPGFFTGVCTVVMKLLAAVQPQVAVFGKKDYQQFLVLRSMVRQFAMPVEMVAAEIVRAGDGLALSSRNAYLSDDERQEAIQLSRVLSHMARRVEAGDGIAQAETEAMRELTERGWKPDYLTVRRRRDLAAPQPGEQVVVLGAATLGTTRLIDSVEV